MIFHSVPERAALSRGPFLLKILMKNNELLVLSATKN
ncbi:hypothetical protein X965_07465 [Morganella sp. EGD-HP17]|nr:hypothetical protein X965_07465 [Morganella sp. EGD-HP17]